MKITHACTNCGTTLTGLSTDDSYCPACLLRQGLLSSDGSPPSKPHNEKPPSLFGSYELNEEIGRGGMGVVYKARQRTLKRTVAVKLLVSGAYSSEALLRRFQTEAESAAGLQHPGIVAIYEFGENDHQPFYAMEHVEGHNLAEVSGGQPLAPRRAATYVAAIAEAVHYAHGRGILHRDLKPSNVLIDQQDRPRITDFGLAKQLHGGSDATVAGQMLGSPNYSAPEQSAGRQEEVGVRSDVYSLGALLYHLLTGRPPFLASTMQETLRLVYETDPISPRALNPDVPDDLDTICLKCLEKTPARRYGSAQELGEELNRFLRGEPIQARRVAALERGWRWSRRHPGISSLAATVVIALTATSAIFYTSARRIERARVEEHAAREEAEENLYAANMEMLGSGVRSVAGVDIRFHRQLLEAGRPRAGERDLRGFEWRHYWTQAQDDALRTLKGHQHVVDLALFSPDGSRLATHSIDGVLKIWDGGTLRELQSHEHVTRVGGFTAGGAQLVFSRPDNSIARLEVATGKVIQVLAPTGGLIGAQPDGRAVVVFGPDRLPVLRSLSEASVMESVPAVPPDTCSVMSADGRWAVVSGHAYQPNILVIDLSTHQPVAGFSDPRPVIGLAISPDGKEVVSGGFDGVLKFWNVHSGDQVRSFKGFFDPVWALAYSPNGKRFAAGGNNRRLRVWDTSTWDEESSQVGHASTLRSIAFAPDGERLISGGEDEVAMIWQARVSRPITEIRRLLRGPGYFDRTPSLAFSPDSKTFAGTAADGTVKIWRSDTIEPVATFPMSARTVAFSADGKSVLGEAYNGAVRRWNLGEHDAVQTLDPKASFANWQVDSLTPQERVTFVADQAATRAECQLCEITSARDAIFAGAITAAATIAMSPDGRVMFVGLPQGGVEAWDLATRQRRLNFAAHKLPVTSLAVSPDGRYLATGSLDNSTKLWDAATGRFVVSFGGHNRPVWALAFSADGNTLAAGSCDKEIILCSVLLRRIVAVLPLYEGVPQGFEQEVRLLKFSPDGNILAAALGDGTLRFFRAESFSVSDATSAARSGSDL
ncbi:MAG: protein kinase [Opitutus sp.]